MIGGTPGMDARLRKGRASSALLFLAVVAGSFAIYTANAPGLASYDSAPNSLLAFNLLENHRLDFDPFRASYFTALGGQYAFAEAPNGHLAPVFPVGAAIATLPVYCAFYLAARRAIDAVPINTPAFEPLRRQYEQRAAAFVAALSVGLFLLCAREIGTAAQAAIATAVYALATSIWSIGSQALWQHGPVNFVVLAMVFALCRATRERGTLTGRSTAWILAAGIFAGFLPVVRPTAILFSLAALLFVGWTLGRRRRFFALGLALGMAPGLAWNLYFFHSPLGGYAYAGIASSYGRSPSGALLTLCGLLVSPSRGILPFTPVLAFALIGAVRAASVHDHPARLVKLLAIASAALVLQYAFFDNSLVGYAYGPRYLSDITAVGALLLVYAIPRHPLTYLREGGAAAAATAAAFALAFVYSVAVQFVGPNSGAAGSEWNAVPTSVDRDPSRVWPLTDNQIERNVRAAYFRFFAWDIARSDAYRSGLRARMTALRPSFARVARGSSIDAIAVLRNTGRSPWYGYDTGVYIGQMRVAVRIVDEHHRTASQQYLYVRGSPRPGQAADALGTLVMPPAAGTYVLECSAVLLGEGAIGESARPFRVIVHVS